MHEFTCPKCHTPHNSCLPRLAITNCLDSRHRGRLGQGCTEWAQRPTPIPVRRPVKKGVATAYTLPEVEDGVRSQEAGQGKEEAPISSPYPDIRHLGEQLSRLSGVS